MPAQGIGERQSGQGLGFKFGRKGILDWGHCLGVGGMLGEESGVINISARSNYKP